MAFKDVFGDVCEYAPKIICEDQQAEMLGYCPDRVRHLCAQACSSSVWNRGADMPHWRAVQLMLLDANQAESDIS